MTMSKTKFLSSLLLACFALAIPAGPVAANPTGPSAPSEDEGVTLEARLDEVGAVFGDQSGTVQFTTESNETLYLAYADPGESFGFYFGGDAVEDDASLASCELGPTGEPNACDVAYGDTLLVALEDLVSEEPDLDELTIDCDVNENLSYCKITWASGLASCWICEGGTCTKYPAQHC